MITIRHLRKEYSNITPLKDINVTIHQGDVISVIGPSGTGKSTLLRCLNLLETPTSGEIIMDGQNIAAPGYPLDTVRQRMGMVFQSFNLFPHMTILENIMAAPVDLKKMPKKEAYELALRLLETVGLTGKEFQYPDQLSGGQRQRAAIARTLAMEPDIILFDEPTSALDPALVGEVELVIERLAKKGMTMLLVTHEMRFARKVANRVFYMDEGGIYEDGTPEQIFEHPEREKTAQFIRGLKVYTCAEPLGKLDFIMVVNGLNNFAANYHMNSKTALHMQTVFEEICMTLLRPNRSEDCPLRLTVEYSPETEQTQMRFIYGGSPMNVLEQASYLPEKLLSLAIERSSYAWNEDAGENCLDILLR